MKVKISRRAKKQLKKLSRIDQIVIVEKIRRLAKLKELKRGEKLKGYKNIYKFRVGSYRVVYKRTSQEVFIVLIGHRKDIYLVMKRLFD